MSTIDKIATWVVIILFVALGVGCIGAFAWDWKWHNLVLAVLAFIGAISMVGDYKQINKKQQK